MGVTSLNPSNAESESSDASEDNKARCSGDPPAFIIPEVSIPGEVPSRPAPEQSALMTEGTESVSAMLASVSPEMNAPLGSVAADATLPQVHPVNCDDQLSVTTETNLGHTLTSVSEA